jgi:hypothetical protein
MRPLPLDETEIPITWTWCLKHLLINLVFWLLLFGIVLLSAYYTQEDTSWEVSSNCRGQETKMHLFEKRSAGENPL